MMHCVFNKHGSTLCTLLAALKSFHPLVYIPYSTHISYITGM